MHNINNKIVITIDDNGTGIDEKILGNVFDPYFTTHQEGEGMGLGLYMSQMTLKKHMNGSITLENIEDGARAKKITLNSSPSKS